MKHLYYVCPTCILCWTSEDTFDKCFLITVFFYGVCKWKQLALQENLPYFQVSNSVHLLMNQMSPGTEEALSVRSESFPRALKVCLRAGSLW